MEQKRVTLLLVLLASAVKNGDVRSHPQFTRIHVDAQGSSTFLQTPQSSTIKVLRQEDANQLPATKRSHSYAPRIF